MWNTELQMMVNERILPPLQQQQIVLRADEQTVVRFVNERGKELARVEYDPDLGDDPKLILSSKSFTASIHDFKV